MPLPKISIITPSYNQGHFIEQTICSILDQGYSNLEYIIMDGGSTDNTVEVIKKYEKHLSYWESEKDKGQSDAINKGFKLATGEIVNWLNSDDYLQAGALKIIAKNFSDTSVNVVCGKSRLFGEGMKDRYSNGTDIYPENLEKTIGWARIDQPETWFRKSAIDKMGLLNADLHYVMDREWWMRYLLLFGLEGVKKIDDVLVNFRLHPDSKTTTSQEKFNAETEALFYTVSQFSSSLTLTSGFQHKKTIDSLSTILQSSSVEINKILSYYFLKCGLEAYAHNDYRDAMQFFKNVDTSLIATKDKKAKENVELRMRIIPKGLKKIVNKLTSK